MEELAEYKDEFLLDEPEEDTEEMGDTDEEESEDDAPDLGEEEEEM